MATSGGIWPKIHKWLALIMAIQILFWFASGLFFAVFPIEQVKSEHMIAARQPAPVQMAEAAAGLARLQAAGVPAGEKVEIRSLAGRAAALVSRGQGPPRLYDLPTGRPLSPIPMTLAARIAEADHAGDTRASQVARITQNSPEYRGALPAWRVDFADGAGRSLYVAADTGVVVSRRSTLWRVYDFLWGLHIMDWRGHENFNHPLLIVATLLGLVVIVTGIIMFPSRLGLTAWLRRRRARLNAARTPSAAPPG